MMMLAMAFFVANDTLVKLARVQWEAGQILVIRGVFAVIMLAIWAQASGLTRRIGDIAHPKLLLRGGMEATIAMSFITALGVMPLADITAILMAAPLIITALSMVLLRERIGWRRWSAVVVGFGGMLLVVRPGGTEIPLMALALAIYSVIGVGLRDLLTRQIPMDIPSVIVAMTSTIGTLLGGGVLVLMTGIWRPLGQAELLYTAGAAGFVILGNLAMIEACRDVELSVVSPFRYVVIVWAVALGIVVFGDWPQPVALLGIALIGASGLYTLHRERIRHRAERQDTSRERG